jgi:hypothetical protein
MSAAAVAQQNMNATAVTLRETLKRLGYAPNIQMKLYGVVFELISDPIVESERLVFIDGIEKKSGKRRRIRIPLMVLRRAEATAA